MEFSPLFRSWLFVLPLCSFALPMVYAILDLRTILLNQNNDWSANTTISFPDQESFANATERWSSYKAPSYSAVISPAVEADIVQAVCRPVNNPIDHYIPNLPKVRLSREYGIPILATGGRHGYVTTLGNLQGGLAIDLSLLDTVSVDQTTGTLVVGGGALMGSILDPVYEAGYEMRMYSSDILTHRLTRQVEIGSCSCPGILGVTLGGGANRFQGVYGIMLDALISVRLVTSSGDVLDASESSNPDLFWGIRGAGNNFGIIVSATYELHAQINEGQIMNVDFIFPASSSQSYFNLLESLNGVMPAKLSVGTNIAYNATDSSVSDRSVRYHCFTN